LTTPDTAGGFTLGIIEVIGFSYAITNPWKRTIPIARAIRPTTILEFIGMNVRMNTL
jgi:hypothetical protein